MRRQQVRWRRLFAPTEQTAEGHQRSVRYTRVNPPMKCPALEKSSGPQHSRLGVTGSASLASAVSKGVYDLTGTRSSLVRLLVSGPESVIPPRSLVIDSPDNHQRLLYNPLNIIWQAIAKDLGRR